MKNLFQTELKVPSIQILLSSPPLPIKASQEGKFAFKVIPLLYSIYMYVLVGWFLANLNLELKLYLHCQFKKLEILKNLG